MENPAITVLAWQPAPAGHNGVGPIKQARRVARRDPGDLPRIGEHLPPRRKTGLRRNHTRRHRGVDSNPVGQSRWWNGGNGASLPQLMGFHPLP